MGIRILSGRYDGGETRACLVDSVTGFAFGPLFDDEDRADDFVSWLAAKDGGRDARTLTDAELLAAVEAWRKDMCPACETATCACSECATPCTRVCPETCGAQEWTES
jgi:hypothetical protein